jgi:hypothetical protein
MYFSLDATSLGIRVQMNNDGGGREGEVSRGMLLETHELVTCQ